MAHIHRYVFLDTTAGAKWVMTARQRITLNNTNKFYKITSWYLYNKDLYSDIVITIHNFLSNRYQGSGSSSGITQKTFTFINNFQNWKERLLNLVVMLTNQIDEGQQDMKRKSSRYVDKNWTSTKNSTLQIHHVGCSSTRCTTVTSWVARHGTCSGRELKGSTVPTTDQLRSWQTRHMLHTGTLLSQSLVSNTWVSLKSETFWSSSCSSSKDLNILSFP